MPRPIGSRRWVVALSAAILVTVSATGSAASAGQRLEASPAATFRTVITDASLSDINRTVQFSFLAVGGSATGFRCALHRDAHKYRFTSCTSPVTFGGLEAGGYTFNVYGVNSAGKRSRMATRVFKVVLPLTGTFTGKTSQHSPSFLAPIKIVVKDAVIQPASSITWLAHCSGKLTAIVDSTSFVGQIQDGEYFAQGLQQHTVDGDTRLNQVMLRIYSINTRKAHGIFTDRTQVTRHSALIASCSTGTVTFTARR